MASDHEHDYVERLRPVCNVCHLTRGEVRRDEQLAQAQAAVNSTLDVMTSMEADQAAMRALLERVSSGEMNARAGEDPQQLMEDIDAYLAAHPAPAPLEAEDSDD